jgi:riboflavin synthase
MFTGLVEALGQVHRLDREGAGVLLVIAEPTVSSGVALGDSVAVNGACLTVVAHDAHTCSFQVGPETLRRTNLGDLKPGDPVNLERSLKVGDRLGGHFVQGHIDGLARLRGIDRQGDWVLTWFGCDAEWTAQMVPKGSVAVDGISLTLVDVTADGFSVALIPHTLAKTTLGRKTVGDVVNLETDLLAKYVSKCLRGGGVTWDKLKQAGYL